VFSVTRPSIDFNIPLDFVVIRPSNAAIQAMHWLKATAKFVLQMVELKLYMNAHCKMIMRVQF
jgi:hypothetical protein